MVENLFTPWRLEYLKDDGERVSCIFCKAAATKDLKEHGVLYRNEHNLVMLNRYPYSCGHIMIAPLNHWESPLNATIGGLHDLVLLLKESLRILQEVYKPNGFNIGMNLGKAGGAGFADHYHLHVIPRWEGDTNFMTAVAGIRLIPEDLMVSYEKLYPLYNILRQKES